MPNQNMNQGVVVYPNNMVQPNANFNNTYNQNPYQQYPNNNMNNYGPTQPQQVVVPPVNQNNLNYIPPDPNQLPPPSYTDYSNPNFQPTPIIASSTKY